MSTAVEKVVDELSQDPPPVLGTGASPLDSVVPPGETGPFDGEEKPRLPDVVHETPKAIEVPVAEFEGEYIRKMVGKIPAINIEMPVGYARGTHLKLEIEVRIRDIAVKEDRNGELTREHSLVVEDHAIKLLGAYTADQLDPGVGGSAAVGAEDEEGKSDGGVDPGF